MKKKSSLTQLGILQEIKKYIETLIENNIIPQKVILFGSFATNNHRRYSDIDLAIISDQFGHDPIKEMMTLSRLTLNVSDRIEAIPFTEQDMSSRYHTLIGEIKKYGKVIYNT